MNFNFEPLQAQVVNTNGPIYVHDAVLVEEANTSYVNQFGNQLNNSELLPLPPPPPIQPPQSSPRLQNASIPRRHDELRIRQYLSEFGWPAGIQTEFIQSLLNIPLRYFICDNSGSMSALDGHRVIGIGAATRYSRTFLSDSGSYWHFT
jgi:hypothetical protein